MIRLSSFSLNGNKIAHLTPSVYPSSPFRFICSVTLSSWSGSRELAALSRFSWWQHWHVTMLSAICTNVACSFQICQIHLVIKISISACAQMYVLTFHKKKCMCWHVCMHFTCNRKEKMNIYTYIVFALENSNKKDSCISHLHQSPGCWWSGTASDPRSHF